MEQGCQAPVFQKMVCRSGFFRPAQVIIVFVFDAEALVGFVDGKAEGEHVDGVGIVVSVRHQQGAAVGLVLRKELHHPLGIAVAAQEHLQVAVIYGIGVLGRAGINEGFQGFFQAKAVDIPLHIKGDLMRGNAFPLVNTRALFLRLDRRVKQEAFTALVQKAQRGRLQVIRLLRIPV